MKWLADKLEAAQLTDELKRLDRFKHGPLRPLKAAATRMAIKLMLVMRLKNLLPALKVVVGSPPYEAKFEDSVVPDHKGDSDDEYEKKDRRTMNEILLESVSKTVIHPGFGQAPEIRDKTLKNRARQYRALSMTFKT